MEVSKKVIVAGHFGVGKTSLIKQFIHQKFSQQYITTIGVKIDKKTVDVKGTAVNLILWDIAGESSAVKIPKKYFLGAHGLIYVFDLTREETYDDLDGNIFEIKKDNPEMPAILLGNKADLVESDFIENLQDQLSMNFSITSAKTGEKVEDAFKSLAEQLLS